MLIPLGILASSGAGAAGSYELLETTVLSGTQASVEFTNLGTKYNGIYQHFQIRALARTTAGTTINQLRVQFNGDTGNNYAGHGLEGRDGSVVSSNFTSGSGALGGWLAQNQNSSIFSAVVMDILDPFETTKNTTIRSLSGFHSGSGFQQMIALTSGLWMNTNALTSIKLYPNNDSFPQYSRFSLYGLKASV